MLQNMMFCIYVLNTSLLHDVLCQDYTSSSCRKIDILYQAYAYLFLMKTSVLLNALELFIYWPLSTR